MAYLLPDLSHWQVQLTAARARQALKHVDGFLFKATEGTSFVDPHFHGNVAAVNGKAPVGAYLYPTQGSGDAEAAFFLRTTGTHMDFVVVDWEAGDRATAEGAVRYLKQHVSCPVVEYRGAWARAHGGDIPSADAAMVPAYGPSSLPAAYKPTHLPLAAWQYTDGKYNGTSMPDHVPGIGGCDVSVVYLPRFFGAGKGHDNVGHDHSKPNPVQERTRYVTEQKGYRKSHTTFSGAALDLKGRLDNPGDSASITKVRAKVSKKQ